MRLEGFGLSSAGCEVFAIEAQWHGAILSIDSNQAMHAPFNRSMQKCAAQVNDYRF